MQVSGKQGRIEEDKVKMQKNKMECCSNLILQKYFSHISM